MKYGYILLSLILVIITGCCKKHTPQHDSKAQVIASETPDSILMLMAGGVNSFGLDVFNNLDLSKPNLIFSPASVYTSLAMVYAGAQNLTLQQMSDVLNTGNNPDYFAGMKALQARIKSEGPVISTLSNSLWIQDKYPFSDDYFLLVKNYFAKESLHHTDFINRSEQARKEINNWAFEKTNKKINGLIKEGAIGSATKLVLVNALYFSGGWADEFEAKHNNKDIFTNEDGSEVETDFMNRKNASLLYMDNEVFSMCEIPYQGADYSFVIILPSTDADLIEILHLLDGQLLIHAWNYARYSLLNLSIPKFSVQSSFELSAPLVQAGMKEAFSDQADFSEMTGEKDLKIGKVVHGCFIEIDEKGTEAAAATAVLMRETSAFRPEKPIDFIVNRPFLFFLKENSTQTILFMGKVGKIK